MGNTYFIFVHILYKNDKTYKKKRIIIKGYFMFLSMIFEMCDIDLFVRVKPLIFTGQVVTLDDAHQKLYTKENGSYLE